MASSAPSHPGSTPKGSSGPLQRDIAAGRIVEGGGTITQQLVKMRVLGHERTLSNKLREPLAAVWLETQLKGFWAAIATILVARPVYPR
jgi:penicillin-binding protein 1A